jgi:hypothetical protein
MDDSLFISYTSDIEEEFCSSFGTSAGGNRRVGNYKLISADIRFKKIYWEKKISDNEGGSMGIISIQDSVLIFGSNGVNKIAFLKLGDKNFQQVNQIDLKSKEIKIEYEKQKKPFIVRARPWQNGLMLVNFIYSKYTDNDYGLLDTAAGTLKPWKPEWLNECLDAKWSSIGGLCLKETADTVGFVLLRNGTDTLAIRYMPYKLSIDGIEEKYSALIFSGNSIISRGWIYLMDALGQVSEKPLDTWVSQIGLFYGLQGKKTSYF